MDALIESEIQTAGSSKKGYEERLNRINDAISLREPDRVPCCPLYTTFPFLWAGYSMAEVLYDAEKGKDAIRKYLKHFEPDANLGYENAFAGQGPILEKLDPTWLEWAGKPGSRVDKNSIHQYIEFPYMDDDDFNFLNNDFEGFNIKKYLPCAFNMLKPLAGLDFRGGHGLGITAFTMQFMNPGILDTFNKLTEIGNMAGKWYGELAAFGSEMEAAGFPTLVRGTTVTAFDAFSNNMRGTIKSLEDIVSCPEDLKRAVEQFYPGSLSAAVAQAEHSTGRFIFIPMHKGMDGFMSDSQYREFYWDTFKRLILGLIGHGYTPWVYTEGRYDSRLEYLAELPEGQVWIHFENVDMKKAKKIVGPHACISGGIRSDVLVRGTVDQVKDEVKRNLDICAPGGGFIFDIADSMEHCKPENVEALFDTVKSYGKY